MGKQPGKVEPDSWLKKNKHEPWGLEEKYNNNTGVIIEVDLLPFRNMVQKTRTP